MDTKINLRIDDFIKEALEKIANEDGKNLSEYIREILCDHVSLESKASEQEKFDYPEITIINSFDDYEKTYDFTYLLTWLFCKYMFPVDTNDKVVITSLKQRVELVISESTFSKELKMEFVKILNDMNRFLVEDEYNGKHFYFPIPSNQLSFNYNLLMNEIWSKK